jgi:RNA polymerase sigma factor (sigma-70 family)
VSPRLIRTLSDERLGGRLAIGEAAAFDELYRRYVHRLAAYGTHLLGDASSGDDVAQVALMRAYQALRGGRAPATVRPWLFRIAHNAAIDVVRNSRELAAELPDRPAHRDPHEAGALVAAIAALPPRQQRVYVLRELHGLRMDETAAELGLTAQQVEQSLFAARNRLAEQLVFGERLTCAAVLQLAAGPLSLRERRALKTHVRSCPGCRSALGARRIAPAVLPEWLRTLIATLGGGAPVAVKVGAMVATATVAAGVPLTVERQHPHVHELPILVPVAHVVRHVAVEPKSTPAPVAVPVVATQVAASTPSPRPDVPDHQARRRAEPGDARSSDGGTQPSATTTAPTPPTTTTDGGDGGPSLDSVDGGVAGSSTDSVDSGTSIPGD